MTTPRRLLVDPVNACDSGNDAMGSYGELFTVQAGTGKVTRLEPGTLAYLLPDDPTTPSPTAPNHSWRRSG